MEAGIYRTSQKLSATQPVPGERSNPSQSKWVQNSKKSLLVVPSAGQAVSMFEPSFWSAFDPKSFPYGDGVFGIERDQELSYIEWVRCLLMREEQSYASSYAESSGEDDVQHPASLELQDNLPRWRGSRDLITVQYCM